MLCPAGFYCTNGTTLPEKCKNGTFSPAGAASDAECTSCKEGYFCTDASAVMHECPKGNYCPLGVQAPIPCPLGTYGPDSL